MKVLAVNDALIEWPLMLLGKAVIFRFSILTMREKRPTRSKNSARLW